MCPLQTADGCFVAVWNDDEKINVAVIVRSSPGVRTVKPDLLGLKFSHQPLRGGLEQLFRKRFHGSCLNRELQRLEFCFLELSHLYAASSSPCFLISALSPQTMVLVRASMSWNS